MPVADSDRCGVVVPLRDGAAWIGGALESVRAQTSPPTEIVVVDDGSSDGSDELASVFPGVTLLRTPHAGPSAARNRGIEHLDSELVAFLDQDDVWHPEHVERLTEALRHHPRSRAATAAFHSFVDGAEPVLGGPAPGPEMLDPWDAFPLGNLIHTPSAVMARRDALLDVGGFRVDFGGVADYHLWLCLAMREPIARVDVVTVGRRLHPASHYRVLVRADPIGRLEHRALAAEDAGRRKLLHVTGEAERDAMMRRIALANAVTELARAALAGEGPAVADAARAVEVALEGETRARRRDLARFIDTALSIRAGPVRRTAGIFEMLERHWPAGEDAAISRAAFAERRARK